MPAANLLSGPSLLRVKKEFVERVAALQWGNGMGALGEPTRWGAPEKGKSLTGHVHFLTPNRYRQVVLVVVQGAYYWRPRLFYNQVPRCLSV